MTGTSLPVNRNNETRNSLDQQTEMIRRALKLPHVSKYTRRTHLAKDSSLRLIGLVSDKASFSSYRQVQPMDCRVDPVWIEVLQTHHQTLP